jgi:hypothetical protein
MQIRTDHRALDDPVHRLTGTISDTSLYVGKRLARGTEQGGAEMILKADQCGYAGNSGHLGEHITYRPFLTANCDQIQQPDSGDLAARAVSEPFA